MDQSRIPVATVHGWTDSLTTLHWVKGQPYRWKAFVANRVSAIQEISSQLHVVWHHCPGVDNPADLASRGCSPDVLPSQHWSCGPDWLADQRSWPLSEPNPAPASEALCDTEARVHVVHATTEPQWWTRFSKWSNVLSVIRRIISWRYQKASISELTTRAERIVIRAIQKECFPQEFRALSNGKNVDRESRLLQFAPFLDPDGVLRATRRLHLSDLHQRVKFPVLLSKHHLTILLLRHVHESRLHQGVEGCLAFVQRKYLVLSCRRLLRSIKSRCVICRRYDTKPASEVPPPLPADRTTFERPFQAVGVDHAGPLLVKDKSETRKAWILLFVCAAIRAVHLQVVASTSAKDFLLAYRRFVARFGAPALVRSDNGSGFVAASRVLKVDWRFNPPASPWHGGFYERLVASVKAPLRRVLGKSLLHWDELATLLAEVEFIVNERPLTHVGGADDLPPLTPNMLLGAFSSEASMLQGSDFNVTHLDVSCRMRYLGRLRSSLKIRWLSEYLLS